MNRYQILRYNCISLFSSFLLYLSILFFYNNNKYYKGFLFHESQTILKYLFLIYAFFASAVYLGRESTIDSSGLKLLRALKILSFKLFKDFDFKVPDSDKNVILFSLVKFFYFPMYINFLFSNITGFKNSFKVWSAIGFRFSIDIFNHTIYPVLFSIFVMIDVFIFILAYGLEHSRLKNKVKSVDKSALGWFVAIICYPPFNTVFSYYTNWDSESYKNIGNKYYLLVVSIILLLTWFVYVWASVALGFKAANLSNRGIVCKGPYKYLRHPAYVFKNISWWVASIPAINFKNVSGALALILTILLTNFVYYLRAITEERHLSEDPDYLEYKKQVPNRFIPNFKINKLS